MSFWNSYLPSWSSVTHFPGNAVNSTAQYFAGPAIEGVGRNIVDGAKEGIFGPALLVLLRNGLEKLSQGLLLPAQAGELAELIQKILGDPAKFSGIEGKSAWNEHEREPLDNLRQTLDALSRSNSVNPIRLSEEQVPQCDAVKSLTDELFRNHQTMSEEIRRFLSGLVHQASQSLITAYHKVRTLLNPNPTKEQAEEAIRALQNLHDRLGDDHAHDKRLLTQLINSIQARVDHAPFDLSTCMDEVRDVSTHLGTMISNDQGELMKLVSTLEQALFHPDGGVFPSVEQQLATILRDTTLSINNAIHDDFIHAKYDLQSLINLIDTSRSPDRDQQDLIRLRAQKALGSLRKIQASPRDVLRGDYVDVVNQLGRVIRRLEKFLNPPDARQPINNDEIRTLTHNLLQRFDEISEAQQGLLQGSVERATREADRSMHHLAESAADLGAGFVNSILPQFLRPGSQLTKHPLMVLYHKLISFQQATHMAAEAKNLGIVDALKQVDLSHLHREVFADFSGAVLGRFYQLYGNGSTDPRWAEKHIADHLHEFKACVYAVLTEKEAQLPLELQNELDGVVWEIASNRQNVDGWGRAHLHDEEKRFWAAIAELDIKKKDSEHSVAFPPPNFQGGIEGFWERVIYFLETLPDWISRGGLGFAVNGLLKGIDQMREFVDKSDSLDDHTRGQIQGLIQSGSERIEAARDGEQVRDLVIAVRDLKNRLSQYNWAINGFNIPFITASGDPAKAHLAQNWAVNHLADDYDKTSRLLVRELQLRERYDNLSPEEKSRVQGEVWVAAGRPHTDDPEWGRRHLYDHPSYFLRAMAAVLNEEPLKNLAAPLARLNRTFHDIHRRTGELTVAIKAFDTDRPGFSARIFEEFYRISGSPNNIDIQTDMTERLTTLPRGDAQETQILRQQTDEKKEKFLHTLNLKLVFGVIWDLLCGVKDKRRELDEQLRSEITEPEFSPGYQQRLEELRRERGYYRIQEDDTFSRLIQAVQHHQDPKIRKTEFIKLLQEEINRRDDIGVVKKFLLNRSLVVQYLIYKPIKYFSQRFFNGMTEYAREELTKMEHQPLRPINIGPIKLVTDTLVSYQNAMRNWANNSNENFHRDRALDREMQKPEFNHDFHPDDLYQNTSTVAVERFFPQPTSADKLYKSYDDVLNRIATANLIEPDTAFKENFNKVVQVPLWLFANVVLRPACFLFGWCPTALVGQVRYKFVKTSLKWGLSNSEAVKTAVQMSKETLYDDSAYNMVINQILCDQLKDVWETMAAKGENPTFVDTQPERTREKLTEFVENMFQTMQKRRNTTQDQMRNFLDGNMSIQERIKTSLKDMFLPKAIDAIVEVIIVGFQSVFKEGQMERQLYNFFDSMNDALQQDVLPSDRAGQERLARQLRDTQNMIDHYRDNILHAAIDEIVDSLLTGGSEEEAKKANGILHWIKGAFNGGEFAHATSDETPEQGYLSFLQQKIEAFKGDSSKRQELAEAFEAFRRFSEEFRAQSREMEASALNPQNKQILRERFATLTLPLEELQRSIGELHSNENADRVIQDVRPHANTIKKALKDMCAALERNDDNLAQFIGAQLQIIEIQLNDELKSKVPNPTPELRALIRDLEEGLPHLKAQAKALETHPSTVQQLQTLMRYDGDTTLIQDLAQQARARHGTGYLSQESARFRETLDRVRREVNALPIEGDRNILHGLITRLENANEFEIGACQRELEERIESMLRASESMLVRTLGSFRTLRDKVKASHGPLMQNWNARSGVIHLHNAELADQCLREIEELRLKVSHLEEIPVINTQLFDPSGLTFYLKSIIFHELKKSSADVLQLFRDPVFSQSLVRQAMAEFVTKEGPARG